MGMLISIMIVSYNSQDTILETLASTLVQSYKNIELIITDDCSSDNTARIVKEWIKKNKNMFTRVIFTQGKLRAGVVRNCNRGFKYVRGKYVKLLAADDIMCEDCIEINVSNLQKKMYDIQFSKMQCFGDKRRSAEMERVLQHTYTALRDTENYGLVNFLSNNTMLSPSMIISTDLLRRTKGFDEKIPYWEDVPFFVEILKMGCSVGYINEITVMYRIHRKSLNQSSKNDELTPSKFLFAKSYIRCFVLVKVPTLIKFCMWKRLLYELKMCFNSIRIMERYYIKEQRRIMQCK